MKHDNSLKRKEDKKMKLNKTRTCITCVSSAKKAFIIAYQLEKENRLVTVIDYPENGHYYIVYFTTKL